MAETKIDVSGDMEPPPPMDTKSNPFSNFLSSPKVPNIRELISGARRNIRPWSEFINWSNFKTVANVQRLSNRLMRNLAYFQSNYLFVFLGLFLYCLITSPLILVVLALAMYGCYKIKQLNQKVTIMQRELNTNQQCILLNVAAMPIFYLAGAGAVMFWVIGASFFFISLHAVFYNIDAIVTEDTESFLSETV